MRRYIFYIFLILIAPFIAIAHFICKNQDYFLRLIRNETTFLCYGFFIAVTLKITAFFLQITLRLYPLYIFYCIVVVFIYLFTKPYKFKLQFFTWSIIISLLTIALVYAMSNYDSLIGFIKNLHAGKYTQTMTVFTSVFILIIVQIFCDAPNWFEWLKDYEITFNTRTFKNIFQSEMIVFNLSIFLWQKNSKVIEVKKHIKVDKDKLDLLKEIALTANIYSLMLFIVSAEIGFMIIFIVIALILKFIKRRNALVPKKYNSYLIFKPKE